MVPYVITYNPLLPRIDEIIKKCWGLLALSKKSSVKYVFQHKHVFAFKRPQNLADILTHSKMNFSKFFQCLYLHVKDTDTLIVKVSMNQQNVFVPV